MSLEVFARREEEEGREGEKLREKSGEKRENEKIRKKERVK